MNINVFLLDRWLGKLTRVRALRVLASSSVPLSGAQIAVRTGLARPQIYQALKEFEAGGLARRDVTPPAHTWKLVRDHPWAARLIELFEMEETSLDAGGWETDRSKLERNLALTPKARLETLRRLQETARQFRQARVVREYY